MTKTDLQNYLHLKQSIRQNKELIKKYERDASAVPVVMTKVQKSQKEWPYILSHETVEAPDPVAYTRIQKKILEKRRSLQEMYLEESELELSVLKFVESLENIRDRFIIKAVYVEGRDQREVAIDLDLTEGRVSQIIKEILEKLN